MQPGAGEREAEILREANRSAGRQSAGEATRREEKAEETQATHKEGG